eukprot:364854-Chlamydomonas_euryale.AAC.3
MPHGPSSAFHTLLNMRSADMATLAPATRRSATPLRRRRRQTAADRPTHAPHKRGHPSTCNEMLSSASATLPPSNSGRPRSISPTKHPNAHTSAAGPGGMPAMTSGAS